jgi:CubicO group peptidase (beta-lactamase class C family)
MAAVIDAPSTHVPTGSWELASPTEAGFDPVKLASALDLAARIETPWPRNLDEGLNADPSSHEPPPWNEILGPTKARTGPNGMLIRHGRIVGAYGDTLATDMTFSVAKSYLSVLTGIAVRDGLIGSIDDRVAHSCDDGDFASGHNASITWRHFLQQTSEWEGTLFSKPDLIDRNRQVGPDADNSRKGTHRELGAPGSFYEYNDVRVNRHSLCLMQLFGRPLPEVLKTEVMDAIGASDTWRWHAYRNATVEVNGTPMASVPGGSHWGGGLFMHSEDHARFGLMVLRDGCWGKRRILPEGWVDALKTPSPLKADYGFLWWLNTKGLQYPSAPQSSYFAMGAGTNLIWLAPSLDLVMVLRWTDRARLDAIIGAVMAAVS